MEHLKSSKRSKPLRQLKVYLSILESVKNHNKLPDLGLSKQAMNKYVSRLKKEGNIKKVGYGTWEFRKEVNLKPKTLGGYSAYLPPPPLVKSDDVRLHNLMFIVKVDFLWKNILERECLEYKTLPSGVFCILVDGFKVWLCHGKVIIYVKPGTDFLNESVGEALRLGLEWFYNFVERLQDVLRVHLRGVDGLVWSVGRKHLSLVKNALAMQYQARGERFKVFDSRGCWLVTDRSFNVDELEFIRSSTNTGEAAIVQRFFNSLKKTPITSDEIMQMFQAAVASSVSNAALSAQIVDALRRLGGVL